MTIPSGARLGAYEIVGVLGAGGMGEVYRARDSKLDREVAIKVLPDAVADDPVRLARFEREAKVLAALSHPNIAVNFRPARASHRDGACRRANSGGASRKWSDSARGIAEDSIANRRCSRGGT